jgi:DnaB-like helicase C terminal domain
MDRTVSLLSGVSLTKIMNGTLNAREEKAIDRALAEIEAMRSFIFSTDITSATTVSGVQAKIQEYQPDAVFIDGAYLMQSELVRVEPGSPQALTNISRSLKRLAQSSKIPIAITTQASLVRSKGGLGLQSAMYTQAWGQDSDIFLGVERMGERVADETVSTDPVQVKFKVIESRSGPRKEVILEWDWNKGHVEELDAAVMRQRLDRRSNPSAAADDGTDAWGV